MTPSPLAGSHARLARPVRPLAPVGPLGPLAPLWPLAPLGPLAPLPSLGTLLRAVGARLPPHVHRAGEGVLVHEQFQPGLILDRGRRCLGLGQ